jgi:uncharacterized membrane protein
VTHSHSHHLPTAEPRRPLLTAVLAVVVAAIAVAALASMVMLWPAKADVPREANPYGAEGTSTVNGTVTQIKPFDCGSGQGDDSLNGLPSVPGDCAHIDATVGDSHARFDLDAARYKAGIEVGDHVRLVRIEPKGQKASYEFLDFQRSVPLVALALAFIVLVVAVARWRGLFALVGIGLTLLALTKFILPALLAGQPAVPVAVTGSTLIMILVLYLAHGVSVRTTTALFGTLIGMLLTAGLGLGATAWAHLTGVASEDDFTLVATAPHLHFSGVVAATMVIAGLGVLNDVTVTQASAVWELKALQPSASRTETFASAMRIGRDHIASSVYTLVFAYAGSAMTVFLLITAYQRGLGEIATTEQVGEEIARTMVGAIGLVLAVPITTLIAVSLAPRSAPVEAPEPDAGGGRRAARRG